MPFTYFLVEQIFDSLQYAFKDINCLIPKVKPPPPPSRKVAALRVYSTTTIKHRMMYRLKQYF